MHHLQDSIGLLPECQRNLFISKHKPKFNIMQFDDIEIDADNEKSLKEGASKVVSRLRPEWGEISGFKYKIFSDGITNKLVGVYIDGENKCLKMLSKYDVGYYTYTIYITGV